MPRNTSQTAGIIASSAACEAARFERGIAFLRGAGVSEKVALNPTAGYGGKEFLFSSDSAVNRARALEALFADPAVTFILAARGAYGSMEILPHLDFPKIAANPKPIVGFSDTTALLISLHQQAGIPAIHGPSVESLGKAHEGETERKSAEALFAYLDGHRSASAMNGSVRRLCGTGDACAPVIGGNLSILSALTGTPWEPGLDGKILFLEEIGERPYRIHRMLLQMKLAGKLKKLSGVVLGDFLRCEHPQGLGPTVEEAIVDIFKDYHYPVAGYVNAGHGPLNKPVPFGLALRLRGDNLEL